MRISVVTASFFLLSFLLPINAYARAGCCSYHGGVCGCGCCDGTSLSTTCAPYYPECSQPTTTTPAPTSIPVTPTQKPASASGCCSYHGGIDYCDTAVGLYMCNDLTLSPTCGCQYIPVAKVTPKPIPAITATVTSAPTPTLSPTTTPTTTSAPTTTVPPSPTAPPISLNNFFSNIYTFLLNLFGLSKSQPTPTPTPSLIPTIGQRTKTSGCKVEGALPDKGCTPGAIFPDVTKDEVCQSGYSSKVRDVPESESNEVYAEYGITSHTTGEYEVDHLISLELGGSNDIANLWPEAATPTPGFHEKDKVENYLHKLLCDGVDSLLNVQYQIANNWLGVYATLPSK